MGGLQCQTETERLDALEESHYFQEESLLNKVTMMGIAGVDNGIPLQYSCLENPMDGGAW